MENQKTIGDMLHELAELTADAQSAWGQFDAKLLLDSLEQIAKQAPEIIDTIFATADNATPAATGKE